MDGDTVPRCNDLFSFLPFDFLWLSTGNSPLQQQLKTITPWINNLVMCGGNNHAVSTIMVLVSPLQGLWNTVT